MLYIGYFNLLDCQSIKKISFGNSIFELPRLENFKSRLSPSPLGSHPPPPKKLKKGEKHIKRG